MPLIEGAKISEVVVNIWVEVLGLAVTETSVTMNKQMHTLGSSDRSGNGIRNT